MELLQHTMHRHGHLVITCRFIFRLFLLRRSPRGGVHENVQQARGSSGTGGGPWCRGSPRGMVVGPWAPGLYPEGPRICAAPSGIALTYGLLLHCQRPWWCCLVGVGRSEGRFGNFTRKMYEWRQRFLKKGLGHLSDISEGGPVGRTAFKEEREMFSASNSTGPGFTCNDNN